MKYLITAIIILAALFYWYEIRPSQIKSQCVTDTIKRMRTLEYPRPEFYNLIYDQCLKSKGL